MSDSDSWETNSDSDFEEDSNAPPGPSFECYSQATCKLVFDEIKLKNEK